MPDPLDPSVLDLSYTMGQRSPLERPQIGSMSEYHPDVRDRIARLIAGDERNYGRQQLAEGVMGSRGQGSTGMGLIDLTPAGVPLMAEETGRAVAHGNVLEAGMGTAGLMLPVAAKGAKALAPAVRRAITSVDLRAMSLPEAIAAAKTEQHLLKTGAREAYVGAPHWVTDEKALQQMRSSFDELVELGVSGARWYPQARKGVIEMAGADPAKQHMLAGEKAIFSARANPDVNLGFALQAHNAFEAGKPRPLVFTRAQAKRYNKARAADVDIPLGRKTGIYGGHLDPTHVEPVTGTNDVWHARAFGYQMRENQGLKAQQHAFLDAETLLAVDRANAKQLGGRSDWTAGEVQAAAWVAKKGDDLARKRFGGDLQRGIAEAAKSYPEYFNKYTAHATYEATPYAKSGHLPELVNAPYEERAAFAAEPGRSWTDANKRDVIHDTLGMYQRPTVEATGVYTPPGGTQEINPARVARPMVALGGKTGARVVDPHSRALLDAAEATRSYMDVQGAGAWSMPIRGNKQSLSQSLMLPHQGPLSREQIAAAQRYGQAVDRPDVIDYGTGAVLTKFGGPLSKEESSRSARTLAGALKKGVGGEELRAAFPGAEPKQVALESGYVSMFEKAEREGTGRATRELKKYLTHKDAPAVLGKLDADPRMRQAALDRIAADAEYGERTGQPVRADVQRARAIIAREGFSGLFAALKRGEALPVGLLALLGLPQLSRDE